MQSAILCQTASDRDNRSKTMKELREKLPPCPICGRKAYLSHDVVDGADYGYSVGCRFFHSDRVRRIIASFHGYYTKEEAFDAWTRFCEFKDKKNE